MRSYLLTDAQWATFSLHQAVLHPHLSNNPAHVKARDPRLCGSRADAQSKRLAAYVQVSVLEAAKLIVAEASIDDVSCAPLVPIFDSREYVVPV